MNGIRGSWIKKNVEAVVCVVLFALLVCVSLYFVTVEKRRAAMIRESTAISGGAGTQVGGTNATKVSQQKRLSGLLVSRPVSYYNLILRRNPFSPLPAFKPGEVIRPQDLVLIRPPSRSDDGELVAQIRNRITGKVYDKREGQKIAGILIKKIERGAVIVSWHGNDLVLEPLVGVQINLALLSKPFLSENGILVARIKDVETGKVYIKREGEEIEGLFTVKKIEHDRVIVSGGEEDLELFPPVVRVTFDFVFTGTIKIGTRFLAQIENLRTGRNYFVEEGETIAEIYTVKKIERHRVILSREGKEDMVLEL